ncbi:L,D-transpeptidase Cds6 family protein [Nitrogeniibacter aestuarii]|uniref:L,D-transpeptidase Cds6 family protein n=1 Tax=Nitrogeniibacter aestuarii TaxID=2815343 RepID=UPI001E317762|nr:ankyrin repeat domain-containing protein [Nitrogeniibacter aestuarii]
MSRDTPALIDRIPGIVWFFAGMLITSLTVGLLLAIAHHQLNKDTADTASPLTPGVQHSAVNSPCPSSPAPLSLAHAIACGELDAARRLLSSGTPPDQIDTRPDWHGRTALHHAALIGNEAAVALLLEAGANPTASDTEENTALHLLPQTKDPVAAVAIARRLAAAGATIDAVNRAGQTPLQTLEGEPSRLMAHQALAQWLHRGRKARADKAISLAETTMAQAPTGAGPVESPSAAALAQAQPATEQAALPTAADVPTEPAPSAAEMQRTAKEDIRKTLQAWTMAWSSKDMPAYLAQYHADFTPDEGLDRTRWAQLRHQRIAGKSGRITVFLRDIDIEFDGEQAIATFVQDYDSGNYHDSTRKRLRLARALDHWQILNEQSID